VILIGEVTKMSEKGWTTHQRSLQLDEKSLSYFREVPKDLSSFARNTKIKPKQSVPLKAVLLATEMTPDADRD
jgi:hypothetical protein